MFLQSTCPVGCKVTLVAFEFTPCPPVIWATCDFIWNSSSVLEVEREGTYGNTHNSRITKLAQQIIFQNLQVIVGPICFGTCYLYFHTEYSNFPDLELQREEVEDFSTISSWDGATSYLQVNQLILIDDSRHLMTQESWYTLCQVKRKLGIVYIVPIFFSPSVLDKRFSLK